jgi:hypothetical protein
MLRLPAEHGKHIRARWQQASGVEEEEEEEEEDDDDDDDDDGGGGGGGGGGYIRETRIMVKE